MSMTSAEHFHRKQKENRPKINSYMQLFNCQATKPGIPYTWQKEILVIAPSKGWEEKISWWCGLPYQSQYSHEWVQK